MGWRCYQKGWSYLRLGLDDDISTQNGLLLSAQRPVPRPLPQLPPRAISRLVQAKSYGRFLQISRYSSLRPRPSSFRSWHLRLSHLVYPTFIFEPVLEAWHAATYAVDVRLRVRAPISLVQSVPSSHYVACHRQAQRFSSSAFPFNDSECPIFTSLLQPYKNSMERPTYPTFSMIFIGRVAPRNRSRQIHPPLSPSHKTPHALNQCSSPITQSATPHYSLFLPLPYFPLR